MTPQEFCYWLQGYFDLTDNNYNAILAGHLPKEIPGDKAAIIEKNLKLVFENLKQPTKKPEGFKLPSTTHYTITMPTGVTLAPLNESYNYMQTKRKDP